MRLISGLPFLGQKHNRYWVHFLFVCFQLFATVAVFWNFWSLRGVEWTFLTFVMALTSPAVIYYNACVLVPENPSEVRFWRDHYFSIRRRYFIGLTTWTVIVAILSVAVLSVPLLHPLRAFNVLMLVGSVSGLLSESPRVHGTLAVFYFAIFAFLMTAFAFRPDSLPTQ